MFEYWKESDDVIMHYGVNGQKWGVRRYQNEDGSLTEEGRIHYGYIRNASSDTRASKYAPGSYRTEEGRASMRKAFDERYPNATATVKNRTILGDTQVSKLNKNIQRSMRIDDRGGSSYTKRLDNFLKSADNNKKALSVDVTDKEIATFRNIMKSHGGDFESSLKTIMSGKKTDKLLAVAAKTRAERNQMERDWKDYQKQLDIVDRYTELLKKQPKNIQIYDKLENAEETARYMADYIYPTVFGSQKRIEEGW